MFTSSIARVIGPTPPGTGVMARRALAGGREVDVPDQPGVGAVGPDVDHHGALAHHVAGGVAVGQVGQQRRRLVQLLRVGIDLGRPQPRVVGVAVVGRLLLE